MPTPTRTRTHGAAPGNQNARRHGWFSALDPAELAEIVAVGRRAAQQRNPELLRHVARALASRGYRDEARRLRQIAGQLETLIGLEEAGLELIHEVNLRPDYDAAAAGAAATLAGLVGDEP